MLDKLAGIEKKYQELTMDLSDPALLGDPKSYAEVAKHHAELGEIVEKYQEFLRVDKELQDAREMRADDLEPEMLELVDDEIDTLERAREELESELQLLLLPRDPNDEKNVIVEIRGGTGGDEAALFAGDLFRMYSRYAERQGWRTELMSSNPTELGGFKEVIFMIEGKGAYSQLKFESGVHRVQRVPSTESGGRIHTSTATVAVLPEAQEVEVEIDPNELRIDVYRSSGPGGQSVNTTDSAVRVTHVPTGMVVSCQDEKSQHKNRDKALRILRARLLDMFEQEQHAEMAQARKSQVGTGDRSERIRTYNFPQGRVSDHRINLTLYRIDAVLDGDLDELIEALQTAQQAEQLAALEA
ncbi:MAG: peptide chain release factor 1 [Firmicutes bacterium]|nr:peptide chain release factor 1 [Bacillota bacterium]